MSLFFTPRLVTGTDISVVPFALDGSVFGWASGATETAGTLDLFTAAGGNLVTTADHYAAGRSEIMIGSWLRTLPDRSKAVIATKIGRHPDAPGLSPRSVVRAVESSLNRLQTDYIDFITLDGEDPTTPIADTLEAIDMLRRAGKVRYLAASGFSAARIAEINDMAASAAYPSFHAVSVPYNLMQRSEYERDLAPMLAPRKVSVIARLPLASGFLTGAFRTKDHPALSPMFAEAEAHVGRRGSKVLDALEAIAAEHLEPLGRVALAWVLSKPGIVASAVRAKDATQLSELLGDDDMVLSRHHLVALDRASG
ncbi:MAG: alcohol dehydrogenase [Microbacteriaceae bacterium]|nr:alcohol dehydrogenase [Microbacteriaceae bacterium]